MSRTEINRTVERPTLSLPGVPLFLAFVLAIAFSIYLFVTGAGDTYFGAAIVLIGLGCFGMGGFYSIQPNEAVAILLFGAYQGTDRATGLRWVWPWLTQLACVGFGLG